MEKELGLGSTLRCGAGPECHLLRAPLHARPRGYGVAPSPAHRARLHLTHHVFVLPLLPPHWKVGSTRAGAVSAPSPRCPSPEQSPARDRRAEPQKQTRKRHRQEPSWAMKSPDWPAPPRQHAARAQQAAPFGLSELTRQPTKHSQMRILKPAASTQKEKTGRKRTLARCLLRAPLTQPYASPRDQSWVSPE